MLSPTLSVPLAFDDSDLVLGTTSADDTRTLTVYFRLIRDVIVAK